MITKASQQTTQNTQHTTANIKQHTTHRHWIGEMMFRYIFNHAACEQGRGHDKAAGVIHTYRYTGRRTASAPQWITRSFQKSLPNGVLNLLLFQHGFFWISANCKPPESIGLLQSATSRHSLKKMVSSVAAASPTPSSTKTCKIDYWL